MNRLIIFLWAAILVFGIPATGNCLMAVNANVTYLIYNQWGGTWQDANKNGQDDSLMCWAAAASNVLAWGGWGTTTYNTTDKIFQHFKDHWTNKGGYTWIGYEYWFDGLSSPYSTMSVVDVPGGGNFYPTLNFLDYYTGSNRGNLMSAVDALMHQGYGVEITISNGGAYSHAITAWGFDYIYLNGIQQYTTIYVTDSDDGVLGLRRYPLIWQDDKWYLGGTYSGWRIANYQALEYLNIYGSGMATATPLPGSWLLVGTGFFTLIWARRKKGAQG